MVKVFSEFPSTSSIVLLLLVAALPAAHAFWLIARGRWYAFDPLNAFWAGAFVVYILQPLEYMGSFVSWHADGTLVTKTFAWTLFSIFFLIVGYEMKIGVTVGQRVPRLPQKLNPQRLVGAAVLLIVLGLFGYVYLIGSAGSLSAWLSQGRGATNWQSVSGYLAHLEHMLPVGAALLLFHVELHKVTPTRRAAAWIAAILLWIWFVYLGTRSRTILWTGTMLVAYYLPRRKNPPLVLLIGVFSGLFVLTNFQEHFRNYFTDLSFNIGMMDKGEVTARVLPRFMTQGAEKPDVSVSKEFNCALTVMELVPSEVSYNYGYGYLEIFTRPIPRAIWPQKRYPAMESVFDVLHKGNLSLAWIATSEKPLLMGPVFTYVGHWWYVGGPIALVLAGLVTGSFFRAIRTLFDRCGNGQAELVLYSQLFALGFFEAAAWPFYWIFSLPLTLLPLLVLIYWAAARKPTAESQSPPLEVLQPLDPGAKRRNSSRRRMTNASSRRVPDVPPPSSITNG